MDVGTDRRTPAELLLQVERTSHDSAGDGASLEVLLGEESAAQGLRGRFRRDVGVLVHDSFFLSERWDLIRVRVFLASYPQSNISPSHGGSTIHCHGLRATAFFNLGTDHLQTRTQ